MKKILFLLLVTFLPVTVGAYDAYIDGIYYQLDSEAKTATVTFQSKNYNSYSGNVMIPETIVYDMKRYTVTAIGYNAFNKSTSLTSVTLPKSLTNIAYCAFEGCTSLTAITIPDGVTTMGMGVFRNCNSLVSVNLSYNLETIPYSAFVGCSALTSIVIPNSVTNIENEAFSRCSNLNLIRLPESLTTIGYDAFSYCNSLLTIDIPSGVTTIEDRAFMNCDNLQAVSMPHSVSFIGERAFYKCPNLTTITIPDSLKTIQKYTFYECSSLESIMIPHGVTNIDITAFERCSNVASVAVEEGNLVYDSRDGCNAIVETSTNTLLLGCKNTIIPNTVITIGNYAFKSCYGLTSITFPESVTTIGMGAFNYCEGLISLTIPGNVKEISVSAFAGCASLKTLIINSSDVKISGWAFLTCEKLKDVYCYTEKVPKAYSDTFSSSTINLMTLHVHTTLLDDFKATEPWSRFGSIVVLDGEEPPVIEVKKCAIPTIAYIAGKIVFDCETEGVEYVYEIKDADVKKAIGKEVMLTPSYQVCAYATKAGYDDSDIATATIRWRDGHPLFEGFSSVVVNQQEASDTNGDTTVDVADIATIIDAMASKSREEREE